MSIRVHSRFQPSPNHLHDMNTSSPAQPLEQLDTAVDLAADTAKHARRYASEGDIPRALEFAERSESYIQTAKSILLDPEWLEQQLAGKTLLRVERVPSGQYFVCVREHETWRQIASGDEAAIIQLVSIAGYSTAWLSGLFACPVKPTPNIRVYTTIPHSAG